METIQVYYKPIDTTLGIYYHKYIIADLRYAP